MRLSQIKPSIAVIIPSYNAADELPACLESLQRGAMRPDEVIVVDDGSLDQTARVAEGLGARVLRLPRREGPASARNAGAADSSSETILFLDADVIVHGDTLERVVAAFTEDPSLDAVFGSYDDAPASRDLLSRYRNLLHCYVHQEGRTNASTFWSGCGAIHKEVFTRSGGFDTQYRRPAIEDIELGYRLRRAGFKVKLDHAIQVKHTKRWSFGKLVRTDIFDRGVPWTLLILETRNMPDDLNLKWSHRISVLLSVITVLATTAPVAARPWIAIACFATLLAINAPFYRFLISRTGLRRGLLMIPFHVLYYLCGAVSFGIGLVHFAWLSRQAEARAARAFLRPSE